MWLVQQFNLKHTQKVTSHHSNLLSNLLHFLSLRPPTVLLFSLPSKRQVRLLAMNRQHSCT